MNQRPEADDQLRHELDTMINISTVQDLNYVCRFALKGPHTGNARKASGLCLAGRASRGRPSQC